MTETDSDALSSDELSPDQMAILVDFDADISEREKSLLEAKQSTPGRAQQHRFCVFALSSSSGMLKEQMKNLAELSQKAFSRMLVVGCLTEDELQD